MSRELWLVRHGATDWSAAGRLTGWTDVPLNALGRDQASALAARLAGQRFAGAWTSDLSRARDTALLAGVDAIADPRLRELDFGSLDGMRWDELPPGVPERLVEFDSFEAPGGESTAALRARVHDFLDGLTDGHHLLVTHGGVIRLLLRESGRDSEVPPGGLIRLSS